MRLARSSVSLIANASTPRIEITLGWRGGCRGLSELRGCLVEYHMFDRRVDAEDQIRIDPRGAPVQVGVHQIGALRSHAESVLHGEVIRQLIGPQGQRGFKDA